MSNVHKYDVFLSHAHGDGRVARDLASKLMDLGFLPRLCVSDVRSGVCLATQLAQAVEESAVCLILLGPAGDPPWTHEHIRDSIDARIERSYGEFRVIPVFLPGMQPIRAEVLPALRETCLIAQMRESAIRFEKTFDEEEALHSLILRIRGVNCAQAPDWTQSPFGNTICRRAENALNVNWRELPKNIVTRNFASSGSSTDFAPSDLTQVQTASYAKCLQFERASNDRKPQGLEEVLQEIFPIESYDKQYKLEYVKYELGKPRYSPVECKQLRLTYGRPFRIWLKLIKDQPFEEEVYLGDLPIMLGGGEFIINGAERVEVNQLHRSPGVDFVSESEEGGRKTFSCRIIPERGSWIELNISKRESLGVRIDQSGKFSAFTLLRAMDSRYSTDASILRLFYESKFVKTSESDAERKLTGKVAVEDIIYPVKHARSGEIIVDAGHVITAELATEIVHSSLKNIEFIEPVKDPLVLNTLGDDTTCSHQEALLRIYQRLRPGNPPQLEKATDLFREKFFDVNRYRLGRVGRFRINRKFAQSVPDDVMTLRAEDFINSIRYVLSLRDNDPSVTVDDIDNLGNRRLRTIDELASDEIRKGFLKLRRTVQERMSLKDVQEMSPRTLVNPKSVGAAIDYFFGRGELSQVVDQTNPLSMLTHERRLSALGPGGLNRKRAGFEVRDVHISHYGRICPIETPEGTNIGLISSLSIHSRVDDYGFLITPYRVVKNGKVTEKVTWLPADEESNLYIAPADTVVASGRLRDERVQARYRGDFVMVDSKQVQFMDIAPSQMVGASAGLIPVLEHDDPNRALMGSNMQRQAVPLLITEPPIVATGLEQAVAENSGMIVRAEKSGTVTYVDANRIEVDGRAYHLQKYVGLNERTCLNQKPVVKLGQKVKRGHFLCDTAATKHGELALGRNVLVTFTSSDGYNFEDAVILSERLVKEDVYTSIHSDEFDVEIRETKLGREEFTRDIPKVSEKALRQLGEDGIMQIGTRVQPGDVLVGKVSPKAKTALSPEEKLRHAIFGRACEDMKYDPLQVLSSDVNSGNCRAESDAEETAYQVNLKMAAEICRQLRLRDLGGVIVNDFIDMREEQHRRGGEGENALRDAGRRDRARTKVLRISPFGLIEMTRQRIRPSLGRSVYEDCPSCHATGFVKTAESVAVEVMRLLLSALSRENVSQVVIEVHDRVANFLNNRKHRNLTKHELDANVTITIQARNDISPEHVQIRVLDATGTEIKLLTSERTKSGR